MDEIFAFVDERQSSWCIHCGATIGIAKANVDHVPSKVLLDPPYPPNLPRVTICECCNSSFSLDEEYFAAFLSAVLSGTTEPDKQKIERARRILLHSAQLRNRIEVSKSSHQTADGEAQAYWNPEAHRISNVLVKNARGHAYFELGEPLLHEPAYVRFTPLKSMTEEERKSFINISLGDGYPELGSRLMTRLMTGQDMLGSWIIVQARTYVYAVGRENGIKVRSIIRDYLATEVCWQD